MKKVIIAISVSPEFDRELRLAAASRSISRNRLVRQILEKVDLDALPGEEEEQEEEDSAD